jgi:hypothetical protein
VRRQFHIFERAVNKFKSDVGLWVQYIQVAKREGARALVGRITARYVRLSFLSSSYLLFSVLPRPPRRAVFSIFRALCSRPLHLGLASSFDIRAGISASRVYTSSRLQGGM